MTDPNVKMKFFGNESDAARALVSLEKKYDKLENSMKQVTRQSRRATQGVVGDLKKWALGFVGVQQAARLAGSVVHSVTEENRRLSRSIDEILSKLTESELKLQIQAGINKEQLEKQIPVIQQALLKTPATDFIGGLDIQRQLISSGFKPADVASGAALQTALDFKAAAGQFGREIANPSEAIQSVSQLAKGLGISEPGAADVRRIGGKITQLFEGSEIQLVDLSALAPKAAGLKAVGLDENIQLSAFSKLRDVSGAEQGATQLDQAALFLRGASQSNKAVSSLATLGLKPEDVDIIGEDFLTVLKRMKVGLDSVDEKTGSDAIGNIFGKKAQKGILNLVIDTALVEKRLGILEGDAFDRNVDIFRGDRESRNRRVSLREEFAVREIDKERGGTTFKEARQILDTQLAERTVGAGLFDRLFDSLGSARLRAGLSVGESISLSPVESVRATQVASESLVDAAPIEIKAVVEVLKLIRSDTASTVEELKQNHRRQPDRNAQGE